MNIPAIDTEKGPIGLGLAAGAGSDEMLLEAACDAFTPARR